MGAPSLQRTMSCRAPRRLVPDVGGRPLYTIRGPDVAPSQRTRQSTLIGVTGELTAARVVELARTRVVRREDPEAASSATMPTALKPVLEPQLNDARRAGLRGDAAEGTRVEIGLPPTGRQLGPGDAPVERIEQIERLEP